MPTGGKLITFVIESLEHAGRYAIDASKIRREFGCVLRETFESGLRKTICLYRDKRH